MEETVNCLKCLLFVIIMFDAAFFVCFLLMLSQIHEITEHMEHSAKEDKREKEKFYTIRCLVRKPTSQCSHEWFTIGREYPVKDKMVPDDQGWKWSVFKYDKLLFEAGGYLFYKVEK